MPRKKTTEETLVPKSPARKKRVPKVVPAAVLEEKQVIPEEVVRERKDETLSSTPATVSVTKKPTYAVIALIVLLILGGMWYQLSYMSEDAQQARAEKEADRLIAEVGTLILLPQGEKPIIYTVDEPELLKRQQPFFIDAQEGDYLLVYQGTAKAIIYRPDAHIIVNVGGIAAGAAFSETASSASGIETATTSSNATTTSGE